MFFLFFASALARLLYIQFFRSAYLEEVAQRQHNHFLDLEPRRGTIYDRNMRPEAVNVPCDSIFISPAAMKEGEKEQAISSLAPALGVDPSSLRNKLARKKSFVWLARKISAQQSTAIRGMGIKGLGFIKESRRSYPNFYLASQVIGFAGLDNSGLEGLELYYDHYLKGEPGSAIVLRDARSTTVGLYEKMQAPRDGADVRLTIDEVIQYIAERELEKAFQMHHAKGGSIVVMDPKTGEILAMASRPTFDSNNYKGADKDQMRNRAVTDTFEPGSVFKIVTASGALEEGKVQENDRIFCENGEYHFAGHILHDHTSHGYLTFKEVIEESSNIGTCKVAQMLGAEALAHYVKLFGFGARTGIGLPGEVGGVAKDARQWSKTSITAVPMGQEVTVTAIQLGCALSAIANGGTLMRPYITMEIRGKNGEPGKSFKPFPVRSVISADTAARMRAILIGVVQNGTGKLALSKEFTAGGKTGTGQKLESNGTYSHSKFMASFMGFAPAEDPQIVVVVVIDEPHGSYYGGVVSAPVFKYVAGDVLKYLKSKQEKETFVDLDEMANPN